MAGSSCITREHWLETWEMCVAIGQVNGWLDAQGTLVPVDAANHVGMDDDDDDDDEPTASELGEYLQDCDRNDAWVDAEAETEPGDIVIDRDDNDVTDGDNATKTKLDHDDTAATAVKKPPPDMYLHLHSFF